VAGVVAGPGAAAAMFGTMSITFVPGQPSATEAWMIQFGGHHLGINITLAGEHARSRQPPRGAQPAIYELEGKPVRPLGREVDKSFALISSLDETQRKQAVLARRCATCVGPGRDGQMIQHGGNQAQTDRKQREMLLTWQRHGRHPTETLRSAMMDEKHHRNMVRLSGRDGGSDARFAVRPRHLDAVIDHTSRTHLSTVTRVMSSVDNITAQAANWLALSLHFPSGPQANHVSAISLIHFASTVSVWMPVHRWPGQQHLALLPGQVCALIPSG